MEPPEPVEVVPDVLPAVPEVLDGDEPVFVELDTVLPKPHPPVVRTAALKNIERRRAAAWRVVRRAGIRMKREVLRETIGPSPFLNRHALRLFCPFLSNLLLTISRVQAPRVSLWCRKEAQSPEASFTRKIACAIHTYDQLGRR